MISLNYRKSRGVKYNAVLDWKITDLLEVEPISTEQVKRHLNLQFDTTGSYEFNDDDTKIDELITECRKALEKYTGCSLVPRAMRAILRNEKGNQEIPYGPINNVLSVVDEDGEAIADVKVRGIDFKWIESPCNYYMDVSYNGGYAALPQDLMRALKEEIAYRYKNQGDQQRELGSKAEVRSESARNLADPYRRTQWLLEKSIAAFSGM